MDEFVTLRKFNTYYGTAGLIELLEKNKIEYHFEKTVTTDEIVFDGDSDDELHVKVRQDDFEAAQKLLEELATNENEQEKESYLFEFSDKELVEILEKPDEWSTNDYYWAQEILKQRGNEIEKEQLQAWKNKRLALLASPDKATAKYIRTAYIFCLLGGFIGFFMGRHLYTFRKILPNGEKVNAFDEASQIQGKRIQIIGIVCLLVYVILFILLIINSN